jgi:hypothetical protein
VQAPRARQNEKTGHIWVRTHHHPDPNNYADFSPSMSGGLESQQARVETALELEGSMDEAAADALSASVGVVRTGWR